MRLLNGGTLNRGRNLWVTVAIDHLTVDGFHNELQPSAKNTKGGSTNQLSQWILFGSLEWISLHFCFFGDLLKFHQFGSTVLPETLLEYVWYAGRWSWEGILMVADLKQLNMMDATEFCYIKLNAKDMISPKLVTIPKNRRWTIKKFLDEIRFWELQLWQGTIQVRGEVQEDFLVESDGFPPTTKEGSQWTKKHGLYRDQRYRHQNCFEKYLGQFVMNFFHKQTYAVHHKQVANMVPGLSTTYSLSSLSTLTPPTSTQDIEGSISDPASIECDSEDRQVRGDPCRNPTNQAMLT